MIGGRSRAGIGVIAPARARDYNSEMPNARSQRSQA